MYSAQRNLQNEWSSNIVAQKEVDFTNFWCLDLQYITSANSTAFYFVFYFDEYTGV